MPEKEVIAEIAAEMVKTNLEEGEVEEENKEMIQGGGFNLRVGLKEVEEGVEVEGEVEETGVDLGKIKVEEAEIEVEIEDH